MFKYPSPWQVLCSSLERREQVSENGEDRSLNVSNLIKENTAEQYVTDSKELVSEVTKESNISEGEPEATAKSAPASQDTRIHADSEQVYVTEEQGANITDSQTSTSTSELTMDRVTRRLFSSFSSTQSINGSQQDLANSSLETQATEKIDNRKDVWVPPPDRRLKLLREEERFEIRTHLPEISPTKLFVDDSDGEEDQAKRRSNELTPEKVVELEKNRRDIIKKQCQRQSFGTEDVTNIGDKIDGSASDIDVTEIEVSQNKPNIHTEQIHFQSVRQRFIKLEKERNSLPITPRPQPRQSRLNTLSLIENYQATKKQEDLESKPNKDERIVTGKDRSSSLLRKQFFKSLSVDSVDNEEQDKSAQESEEEKESIPNPSNETPIEREIRLALEREESLRKERGILNLGETKEIVEISKNSVLAYSPDMLHSKKNKNRPHTSLVIQREIEREVQREADLKSEGRVAGLYDKGNSQELDERRKLFEQPDEVPVQPQQGSSSKMGTNERTCNISQADLETDSDAKNWTALDSPQPYSVRMKWKPTPSNVYRNRRLSADNILDIKTPLEKESSEETFPLRRENFHIEPLKFCLRVQSNDGDVDKNHTIGHREKYNTRLRPSLSNIIEQEIQQTLERERELQEERRKSGLPQLTVHNDNELNNPPNGYDTPDTSSLTPNVSNTWSSAPWKGTLGDTSPSYDISTVQIFKPQGYPKFEVCESDGDMLKRHEKYAGIDPSDAVNTEIVESTRVNRHKSTMALRWEAGLYANEESD